MTLSVMLLNMFKLRRLIERRHIPIQFPQPFMQRRVPGPDVPDVALEMLHVHGIEAHDGGVQSDVGFGDVGPEIIGRGVLGQVLFCAVEGGEERCDGFLVGVLGGGEAGFVDAVVDVVVGPVVCCFDVCCQVFRE